MLITILKRKEALFAVQDIQAFASLALAWAGNFTHFTYFNPNHISYPFGPFLHFLAVGSLQAPPLSAPDPFVSLQNFYEKEKDWLIGYFCYDLKNKIEKLESKRPDRIQNPDILFYQPRHLVFFEKDQARILSVDEPVKVFEEIMETTKKLQVQYTAPEVKASMPKDDYLERVDKLKQHIIEGDIYEINLCMEFFAENVSIDAERTYQALCRLSPMPFSIYQKIEGNFLIAASPERFLKKSGNKLVSQPIKGTMKRGKNREEDEILKQKLRHDEKELSENLMIVDLVRNDLARSAVPGSVKVEELFGIYTFKQVHQMISTVSANLKPEVHFIQAIKNAFPMGSMTGAPKIKVMELIEKYEVSKRGLYSGAAGYISPQGDFDFNVVIRSILYNSRLKMLSFQVGSAITYDAQPAYEYEECLLKAEALLLALK